MKNLMRLLAVFVAVIMSVLVFSCKTETDSTETEPTYYTVSFDSDGGTEVTSQTVESGKTATKPANPTKDGYTFTAWHKGEAEYDFSTPVTSNIILKANWSKNTVYYTITYKSDYGTIPDTLKNGISLAENTILTNKQLPSLSDDNAIFKGWYDGEAKAVAGEYAVTKNVTLTAMWADEATVTYASAFGTVPTSFTAKLNQTLTAENLSSLDCPPYTFLGWFYNKDESGNGTGTQAQIGEKITADTTLYAKWQTATVTFETQFGEVSSMNKYTGEKITESEISTLSETGYTFGGWFIGSAQLTSAYTVTGDVTFTAKWTPNTDTPYKVYHYQQNADDDGYTLKDTDNMTGTTATQTNASAKSYEHFMAGTVTQTAIDADGSTEVRINYDRETVTFTLDLAGGMLDGESGTVTKKGKYGQTVLVNAPEKTGYNFLGWNEEGGELPTRYDENATYTAIWSAGIKGITVTVNNADITVTKTVDGSKIIFTADDTFVSYYYKWYFDDEGQSSYGTTSDSICTIKYATPYICTIDTSKLGTGLYTIALEARKNGNYYSWFAQIKVTE